MVLLPCPAIKPLKPIKTVIITLRQVVVEIVVVLSARNDTLAEFTTHDTYGIRYVSIVSINWCVIVEWKDGFCMLRACVSAVCIVRACLYIQYNIVHMGLFAIRIHREILE